MASMPRLREAIARSKRSKLEFPAKISVGASISCRNRSKPYKIGPVIELVGSSKCEREDRLLDLSCQSLAPTFCCISEDILKHFDSCWWDSIPDLRFYDEFWNPRTRYHFVFRKFSQLIEFLCLFKSHER